MYLYSLAVVKFDGLSSGGTEKFLRNVAAHLPKDHFSVTFFYCENPDREPSDTSHSEAALANLNFLHSYGVRTVRFRLAGRNLRTKTHDWLDTDFWDLFSETEYDLILSGRAGHREYPFHLIRSTKIVDSLHLNAGVHNQVNIAKVLAISEDNRTRWINRGGDARKVSVVSHPIGPTKYTNVRTREPKNRLEVVFGFHQRASDAIFSPVPLAAYSRIESSGTRFRLLGGGPAYRRQAEQLRLKNVDFLDHTGDPKVVESFMETLDIYAHGRLDGEINSTAIAEAIRNGLPVVSHESPMNNGHREVVRDVGFFASSFEEYVDSLTQLRDSDDLRRQLSAQALRKFLKTYEVHSQMRRLELLLIQAIEEDLAPPEPFADVLRNLKGQGDRVTTRLKRHRVSRRWAKNLRKNGL